MTHTEDEIQAIARKLWPPVVTNDFVDHQQATARKIAADAIRYAQGIGVDGEAVSASGGTREKPGAPSSEHAPKRT